MDNKTQNILQKFSAQKVELSVGSDARRLLREFEEAERGMLKQTKVLEQLLKQFQGFEKMKDELSKQRQEALKYQGIYLDGKDKVDVVFDKLEKHVKELGISVTDIPAYDLLNNAFNRAANAYRPLAELVIDARNITK